MRKTYTRGDLDTLEPGLYELDDESRDAQQYDMETDSIWYGRVYLFARVRANDKLPPGGIIEGWIRPDGKAVMLGWVRR